MCRSAGAGREHRKRSLPTTKMAAERAEVPHFRPLRLLFLPWLSGSPWWHGSRDGGGVGGAFFPARREPASRPRGEGARPPAGRGLTCLSKTRFL